MLQLCVCVCVCEVAHLTKQGVMLDSVSIGKETNAEAGQCVAGRTVGREPKHRLLLRVQNIMAPAGHLLCVLSTFRIQ